jgi:drug/metabolite transporter (DMT)-like permease
MSAPEPGSRVWLWYAIATTVLWGFWGAFTSLSAQRGFPDTLVYCVWALTMIPPALFALARTGWKLERDTRSVAYGLVIGFLGAGGQMILFYTLTKGPAYLIFPVISLSPVVTIAMSYLLLRERTTWIGAIGIALALIALPLFDFSPEGLFASEGMAWLLPSVIIMASWGVQAYFMKVANRSMSAESIFFYMMLTGLLLGPVAWTMTDFGQPINWGLDGPYLAAIIQLLNAIGALLLVYAFRYGKALVVSPLTNAGAPLMTAVISLLVIGVVPGQLKLVALGLALIAALLLSLAEDVPTEPAPQQ